MGIFSNQLIEDKAMECGMDIVKLKPDDGFYKDGLCALVDSCPDPCDQRIVVTLRRFIVTGYGKQPLHIHEGMLDLIRSIQKEALS